MPIFKDLSAVKKFSAELVADGFKFIIISGIDLDNNNEGFILVHDNNLSLTEVNKVYDKSQKYKTYLEGTIPIGWHP